MKHGLDEVAFDCIVDREFERQSMYSYESGYHLCSGKRICKECQRKINAYKKLERNK